MSARSYDFVQLDVFTRSALAGNALAIFTDATGLSDAEMQALAREMNLSETVFILPQEPDVESIAGIKGRIFTIEEELPFAGHPTLGTALYLNSLRSADQIVLDLKVGKVPVRFRAESSASRGRADGNVFGEMRQPDPEFGTTLSREKVASVLGLAADVIAIEWPIEIVSTGLPFAILPVRDPQTLSSIKPNMVNTGAVLEGTGARFFYFIAPELGSSPLQVHARMFFYGGEDPATGSAAGCAASWLVKHGIAKSDEQVLIRQGVAARRPSEIFIRSALEGGVVSNVRVGGYAVEVVRGTATI